MRRVRSPLPAPAAHPRGHITVRQAQQHLPETVLRSYFTFAFVCNPYDRYVSLCATLHSGNAGYVGNETAWMKRTLDKIQGQMDAATFRRMVLIGPQAGILTASGRSVSISSGPTKRCRVRLPRYVGVSAFPSRCFPWSTPRRMHRPIPIMTTNSAASSRASIAATSKRSAMRPNLPFQPGCPEGRHEEQSSDGRGRAGCKRLRSGVPNAP